MGLLLLANLDPVDRFWSQLPRHISSSVIGLKVYVDDFMLVFSFDISKVTEDQIKTRVAGAYKRLEAEIKRAGGNFAVGKGKVAATRHEVAISISSHKYVKNTLLLVFLLGAKDLALLDLKHRFHTKIHP